MVQNQTLKIIRRAQKKVSTEPGISTLFLCLVSPGGYKVQEMEPEDTNIQPHRISPCVFNVQRSTVTSVNCIFLTPIEQPQSNDACGRYKPPGNPILC